MKDHEFISRTRLPRRSWFVVRLDGKAFHTFTKGLQRPYDERIFQSMDFATKTLCEESDGVVFAYTQSDEISLVFGPGRKETQPWFDGQVQKIVSVTASMCSVAFNNDWFKTTYGPRTALFDSRIFSLPDVSEVANYLIWRQQDAVRNSISMAAQAKFSHKELQGVKSGKMQEMLFSEHGINWNDYPARFKRGGQVVRKQTEEDIRYVNQETHAEQSARVVRNRWVNEPADSYVHGLLIDILTEASG